MIFVLICSRKIGSGTSRFFSIFSLYLFKHFTKLYSWSHSFFRRKVLKVFTPYPFREGVPPLAKYEDRDCWAHKFLVLPRPWQSTSCTLSHFWSVFFSKQANAHKNASLAARVLQLLCFSTYVSCLLILVYYPWFSHDFYLTFFNKIWIQRLIFQVLSHEDCNNIPLNPNSHFFIPPLLTWLPRGNAWLSPCVFFGIFLRFFWTKPHFFILTVIFATYSFICIFFHRSLPCPQTTAGLKPLGIYPYECPFCSNTDDEPTFWTNVSRQKIWRLSRVCSGKFCIHITYRYHISTSMCRYSDNFNSCTVESLLTQPHSSKRYIIKIILQAYIIHWIMGKVQKRGLNLTKLQYMHSYYNAQNLILYE